MRARNQAGKICLEGGGGGVGKNIEEWSSESIRSFDSFACPFRIERYHEMRQVDSGRHNRIA